MNTPSRDSFKSNLQKTNPSPFRYEDFYPRLKLPTTLSPTVSLTDRLKQDSSSSKAAS